MDEKPFSCSFCTFTSCQKGNVRLHMRRKHPDKLCSKPLKSRRKVSVTGPMSGASLLVAAAEATASPKKVHDTVLEYMCCKP